MPAELKKKIPPLYLALSGLVICAYVFFLLLPTLKALAGLIPKVTGRRTEIKNVRSDLPREDTFRVKQKRQCDRLTGYEMKLSREKELPLLLEGLSSMAKKSRVKILGIRPLKSRLTKRKKDTAKEKIYRELPIEIRAESGYHQLGAFINMLETDRRYMQVSDIKIQANSSGSKWHKVEFVVCAYTFKQSE